MGGDQLIKLPKVALETLALVSALSQKIVSERDHSPYKQQETVVTKPSALERSTDRGAEEQG